MVQVDLFLGQSVGDMTKHTRFVSDLSHHHLDFARRVIPGLERVGRAQVIVGDQMDHAGGTFHPGSGGEDVETFLGQHLCQLGQYPDLVPDPENDFFAWSDA